MDRLYFCNPEMNCLEKNELQPFKDLGGPLDSARPAYRLDLLSSTPHPDCVEAYVPRRDCFCRQPDVRRRIAALRGDPA